MWPKYKSKRKGIVAAPKKKSVKKKSSAKLSVASAGSDVSGAAALLFAGAAVILLGTLQNDNNIQLLLIGFGAALALISAVLLGMAIPKNK